MPVTITSNCLAVLAPAFVMRPEVRSHGEAAKPELQVDGCRDITQISGWRRWLASMTSEPEEKRVQLLEWLLAQGLNLDLAACNSRGENPLHCAVMSRSCSVLQVSLRNELRACLLGFWATVAGYGCGLLAFLAILAGLHACAFCHRLSMSLAVCDMKAH